jgi:hypothetical protein
MKLIATKKLTYATRHLVAGDPFEARDRDARILIGIRKAKAAETRLRGRVKVSVQEEPAPVPMPPTPSPPPSNDGDEIARLRKTARLLGIVVDKRWGSQTLRDRIAAVRGY